MGLARVRRVRIEQLAEQGNKAAKLVLQHLDDPDSFISACQLGITVATLALGALGEANFAGILCTTLVGLETTYGVSPQIIKVSQGICFTAVFVITAYFQTVVGELIPKTWTFQRAESVILWLAYPMHLWIKVALPFIHILNWSTDVIMKAFQVQELPRRHFVHTEEELKMLVSASHEEGVLEPEEEEMLHSVFDFSDTVASEIMTPRTDMVCVPATAAVKKFVDMALETGHSRLPVYEEDLDNIFGLVHIRDGLRALVEHKENSAVRELARKVLIVPENKALGDLLAEFKKTKTHMAIIVDEYGGTRGMVTFEDLLEELVGDIADEHEIVEEFVIENADGSYTLDAKIPLYEANEKLGLDIQDEDYNTLGGHVFGELGHEPQPGDEVKTETYTLRVEESDRHRISKLRLIKHPHSVEEEKNGTGKTEGNGSRDNSHRQLEAS